MNNLSILLTGGTGSFGNKFVEMTLKKYNPKKLIIFSRDEMKQWHMSQKLTDSRLRYFLGDIRDKDRLNRAADGVDIIIHAAAYKHVNMIEKNRIGGVINNVLGTKNCIDLSIEYNAEKFILVSTDKAVRPTNVMGASKRICELYVQNVDSKTTR